MARGLPSVRRLGRCFAAWVSVLAMVAGMSGCTPPQEAAALAASHAPYAPAQAVAGEVRIWASPEDAQLLDGLGQVFREFHPEVRLVVTRHGPESAIAGVYTDVADLALMARELRDPLERMAYEWVKLDRPFLLAFAHGALDGARPSAQLAVMVHRDNPLASLSLAELDALLGVERLREGPALATWRDLGVEGALADRAISVHGPRIDSIAGHYLRRQVLRDSRKWRPDYRESTDDGQAAVAALSDPAALVVAPLGAATDEARIVPLRGEQGEAVSPGMESIVSGHYPLARSVSMAVGHTADRPMAPPTRAFLRFLLSREGQAVIAAEGSYLPIGTELAAQMRDRLDAPPVAPKRTAQPEGMGELVKVGPERVVLARPDLGEAYAPRSEVAGVLSIWGHGSYGAHTDFVEGLTRAWQDGFQAHHPGIVFENRLHGTASAIGALYTGTGHLAFMGREIWAPEIAAFREVKGYEPLGVDVLTGSYDVRNKGYAISVFVHRDNPLQSLDLAQLDAVFGVDRLRGHPQVETWGDLGVDHPEWKDQPINLYGLPIARGFADYVQTAVFQGARKWKPGLREFADAPGSRGGVDDGGYRMVRAMADDRYAIGYAGMLYPHPQLKPLAIAPAPGAAAVPPRLETVADHSYPLTRFITMFIDRKPGEAVDPKVAEFLRYILSREGQQAVIDHGQGYLPLPAAVAEREARKLE